MPRFSAFTRFSHLRFSHKKSHGERIYDSIADNLGENNFDLTNGTVVSGKWYRVAMRLAHVKYTLERVGQQFRPTKAAELLPQLEWEFGIRPHPRATIQERRASVAAAARVARGARKENVERVLRTELGDDFVAYIPKPRASAVASTTDPAAVGVWNKPGTLHSVYRLNTAVSTLGIPLLLSITHVAGEKAAWTPGQRVALDVGNDTRAEAITVGAASLDALIATFTKPHNPGTLIVSGRTPNVSSTKRINIVALSPSAMNDPEKRRTANRILRKVLRGVSTWCLARPTSPGVVGPFVIGSSLIGYDPLDVWTYSATSPTALVEEDGFTPVTEEDGVTVVTDE